MAHHKSLGVALIVAMTAAIAIPITSSAQDSYPSRTIKIVVPLPPGPVADVLPRIIAQKLAEKWGQPVVIENRPGASQNLGAEAVARAAPDGYTLLATPQGPLAVSQHFFPKLGFDPTAFVPVTIMVTVPSGIVVNPKIPVSTLPELIAYAKANPDKITYGSAGAGSPPHLAMEKLMSAAGIRLVHVPYQGLAPAVRDLIAGHIDMMVDALGNSLTYINEDKLRILAVTTAQRAPELPKVATASETLPGYVHSEWFAIVAPPKTPAEIALKLSQAIAEILKQPDVIKQLGEFMVQPVGSSPVEAAALIKRESEGWRKVIAASGLKSE